MTQINSLAALGSGSIQVNSINFYGTFVDDDFNLTLTTLRKVVGNNVGALVVRSTNQAMVSGDVVLWQAAVYDTDTWWDATSAGVLRVPHGNISHVRLTASFNVRSLFGFHQVFFHHNGALMYPLPIWNVAHDHVRVDNLVSGQIPVSSGDRLECVINMNNNTDLVASTQAWFSVEPVRFV